MAGAPPRKVTRGNVQMIAWSSLAKRALIEVGVPAG